MIIPSAQCVIIPVNFELARIISAVFSSTNSSKE